MLVSGTATAAVLTKAALDEFLMFLRRVRMVTEEKTVDLVLCDEHFALTQEAGLSIKVPFLVWQVVEDDADAVGAIR